MRKQQVDILKAWHAIEFFQPYELLTHRTSLQIYLNEASNLKNEILPWLDELAAKKAQIPKDWKVKYTLHFAVFDKKEVTKAAKIYLSDEDKQNKWSEYLIDEHIEDEGKTCYARLTLNEYGTPDFSDFSISTLPWALGKLTANQLNHFSLENYKNDVNKLKEAIRRIEIGLPSHPLADTYQTMDMNCIKNLIKQLLAFANYTPQVLIDDPDHFIAFQLDCKPLKPKDRKDKESNRLLSTTETPLSDVPPTQALTTDIELENKNDEIKASHNISDIPILNSFFIDDLESAINSFSRKTETANLKQYLSLAPDKLPDLYSEEGLELIKKNSGVRRLPRGRWPSDPSQSMSLMQQFAINTAIKHQDTNFLLSVNGPPGTGKTTLIKEIIAHIVTERASKLASFDSVDQTIDANGYLDESLQGFEILVASSNNAAIKNISEELPLLSSIHSSFSHLNYLKKVSQFLVAEKENKDDVEKNKRYYKPLEKDKARWGMIATTLGKSANRDHFNERCFYKHVYQYPEEELKHHSDFSSLWQWHQKAHIKSFQMAKKDFNKKTLELEQLLNELSRYEDLLNSFEKSKDSWIKILNFAEWSEQDSPEDMLNHVNNQSECSKHDLNMSYLKIDTLKLNVPNFIHRLFKTKKFKNYVYDLQYEMDFIDKINMKMRLMTHLQEVLSKLKAFQRRYADIRVPKKNDSIFDPELQKAIYWQNPHLNRLRSEVFIEAMNLHQSWLNEALTHHSFKKNVREIPGALKNAVDPKIAKPIWQILFMITPVITTTFASLGNMLSHIKQNEFGWLFIDEAGQAIPQAAVGGIYRCKRVLAVGDPLQIQPVLTTPVSILNKLCTNYLSQSAQLWNPSIHSVQDIIDRSSKFGCTLEINGHEQWVGIPLWVHRRCIEPMFSLSNGIAYCHRMVHAKNNNDIKPILLNSQLENAWINSSGKCCDKQYKHELLEDLSGLLEIITSAKVELSSIFIITPFKTVLRYLKNNISHPKLKTNMGTIHTFQGKENEVVIMVLGCCPENAGGATWASSAPNMINVALTRAKNNFFVIGDMSVWGHKPFFSDVAQKLKLHPTVFSYHASQLNTVT
jgi:hypothetical protein